MKKTRQIIIIGLCILTLICSVPVMGYAGYKNPDSVFRPVYDLIAKVTNTEYTVKQEGEDSYLYFKGEKV
ncbi:MAG: hypothetical protein IKU19_07210, partial [Clostridia bacterium]|nr:hypothetical protein [Clostridia bacterium]